MADLPLSRMAPDDLARLLDQELWSLQRLGLNSESVREVPTIAEVAATLRPTGSPEDQVKALLDATLDDAGRGIADYEAARAWYGLTAETSKKNDIERHIVAWQILNDLGRTRMSYDAFRTRRSLTINEDISYRIMLRYRQHLSLSSPKGRVPDHLPLSGSPFSLAAGGLPAPQWFVGRDDRLTLLDAAFERRSQGVPPMAIISGTGGMGKTALALRWAHLNVDQFPDGQLYIDLRGFHPSMTPVGPAAALQSLLDMLGVDRSSMPGTFEGQLALYRRLTETRRLLLIADNARDSAQVDALIPSGRGSMMIVTSRNRLSGLAVRHAEAMRLDQMNADEARDLLCGYLGEERVGLEPESAQAIIEHSGGMPLALSIVASRARQRPDFSLATFAEQLPDSAARLDALDTDDPVTSIRAVMSWSYSSLSVDAAIAFRMAGMAPGVSLGVGAASALFGWDERQTDRALKSLETASLITQTAPGRFGMHDLVRLYAIEQARVIDTSRHRDGAVLRLTAYYLESAFNGDRRLAEFRRPVEIPRSPDGVVAEGFHDEHGALTWFGAEYQNLVAAQRAAVDRGWPEYVWAYAWTLDNFRWRHGLIHDDVDAWLLGLEAAMETSPFARGLAHRRLGRAYGRTGDWSRAIFHTQQAIDIANEIGDRPGAAHSFRILSWLHERTANEDQAMAAAQESYDIYSDIGNPVWTAHALSVLGECHSRANAHDSALDCWHRALALHQEHQHESGEAETLAALGKGHQDRGEHAEAADLLEQAAVIYTRLTDTYNEADVLVRLGDSMRVLEQPAAAIDAWTQALAIYEQHGREDDAEAVRHRLRELKGPSS